MQKSAMSIVTEKKAVETLIFLKAFLSLSLDIILFTHSLYGRAARIFARYRETCSGRFATIVPSGSYRLAYREEGEWVRAKGGQQRGRAHATSSSVFKAH